LNNMMENTVPPKKRRTQEQRRAESGRKLLGAAALLIGQKGFVQTSLEEIGLKAGYSRGLVSHRYGSKEGLARELVHSIIVELRQNFEPITEEYSGLEAVRRIAKEYIISVENATDQTRALYVLIFESLGPLSDLRKDFDAMVVNFSALFQHQLELAKKSGEIPQGTNCETAAFSVVAHLRGITLMWLTSPDMFDLSDVFNEFSLTLNARFSV
jgi:AcrR family transcriptional regulator